MTRVLHYIASIGRRAGGVGSYMKLLSYGLGRLADLHIVTHHSEDEEPIENCHVHYVSDGLWRLPAMKREFCALLEELKPDVVQVNGCWLPQCAYTVIWAKEKGYPVVLAPHGMLEPWDVKKNYWTRKLPALMLYQRRAIRKADMMLATSEQERDNLLRLGLNDKVSIVANGIMVDGVDLKDSWQERKQMLFLALYRKNKGIDLLMQAVAAMKQELQGWTVTVAGIEADYTIGELREMAVRMGVADIVKVVGGLFGDEKWKAYRDADVFVLPTLNENFGIVIAESLLCGTPVITTKGAPWPMLAEKQCGWWLSRSVDDLVKAIKTFLKTSVEEREAMGRRGRKLVEDNFSTRKIAQDMLGLYERTLSGK